MPTKQPELKIPPRKVQDLARLPLRYGDGFITAGYPPMTKPTDIARK